MQSDVPAAASIEEKVAILADRLNARVVTCSVEMARRREEAGARVLDLRSLVSELSPDHVPGERLKVDLIRAGRQPQQAIGFLPDGDMVVVNDAEEMVGRTDVEVVVLSTRPTNQGLLVFARIVDEAGTQSALGSGQQSRSERVAVTSVFKALEEPGPGLTPRRLPGSLGPLERPLADLKSVLPEQGHETGPAEHP